MYTRHFDNHVIIHLNKNAKKTSLFSNQLARFVVLLRTVSTYRGADKSLARSGRKQATATEDFDVQMYYLLS
jgi:hypothetical protein